MDLKLINISLLVMCLVLGLNLFFSFEDIMGNVVKEELSCEINGNAVDKNLCCYELQRFSSCENGECIANNYNVLFNKEMLKYCKKEGYDVKF